MQTMKICQSCAMPLTDDSLLGANADGSANAEYCKYCYQNGHYTREETMEEMIESCVPFMVGGENGFTEEQARKIMQEALPQLKRWKQQ